MAKEAILNILQKRYQTLSYKRLEWVSNETLQLQRMAHEELGAGSWVQTSSSVPVTLKDEPLAALDVSNVNHPSLKYTAEGVEKIKSSHDSDTSNNVDALDEQPAQNVLIAQSGRDIANRSTSLLLDQTISLEDTESISTVEQESRQASLEGSIISSFSSSPQQIFHSQGADCTGELAIKI